jgi:glycosyltransferase involved in cell wall biosynthesis
MNLLPNQPLVSVITPSFNQGQFIEETIQSVLNQNFPHIEYIVVDGGSTDGALAVIQRYQDRLVWLSEPDRGQADAINKGFRMAEGDILAWLCSDDTYVVPDAVSTVVDFFLQNPGVGMVYGQCNIIDEQGRFVRVLEAEDFDLQRLIHWSLGSFIPQPATFFRRAVLDKVGMLDVDLHFSMDVDLWIRIGREFEVRRIPYILANFRMHPGSKGVSQLDKELETTLMLGRRYGASRFSPRYVNYLWFRLQRTPLFPLFKKIMPSPLKRWIYAVKDSVQTGLHRLAS